MSKTKVIVLGANGMLGHMVVDILREDPSLMVKGTAHTTDFHWLDREGHYALEVSWPDSEIEKVLSGASWVVNCIGITKPRINEKSSMSVEDAIRVNSLFPHRLAAMAKKLSFGVIQIATDCVYSGQDNMFYTEDSPHDPSDVYGKTKSLGEVVSDRVTHLRCSIIGPELPGRQNFLLEWVKNQPKGATIQGYTNHYWNGITTEAFAKVCRGIIHSNVLPPNQHLVPRGVLNKCELLEEIAQVYGRDDLTIVPTIAPVTIHRVLDVNDQKSTCALWNKAGYLYVPGIRALIEEMAALC
jgi:dTDP-4-dehydrorhamnose reductase